MILADVDQHAVTPSGKLRFALTCRYVKPELVSTDQHWKGDYLDDPADHYHGDEDEMTIGTEGERTEEAAEILETEEPQQYSEEPQIWSDQEPHVQFQEEPRKDTEKVVEKQEQDQAAIQDGTTDVDQTEHGTSESAAS